MRELSEHDEAIRGWFEEQGWLVASSHYDFDREVYAWRHEAGTERITLRIARTVLEDWPPGMVLVALESRQVAQMLRARPGAYTVIRRRDGSIAVEQLDGPPPK